MGTPEDDVGGRSRFHGLPERSLIPPLSTTVALRNRKYAAKGKDGRRVQPDRETTWMPMADLSRPCLRPRGRSTDAEEMRDDHDERNDEKDVDQPTGCRDGDKPEEPKHQDHACDYEQHVETCLSRSALTGHDSSPRAMIACDHFVMP